MTCSRRRFLSFHCEKMWSVVIYEIWFNVRIFSIAWWCHETKNADLLWRIKSFYSEAIYGLIRYNRFDLQIVWIIWKGFMLFIQHLCWFDTNNISNASKLSWNAWFDWVQTDNVCEIFERVANWFSSYREAATEILI